jgi:hypothetical protein
VAATALLLSGPWSPLILHWALCKAIAPGWKDILLSVYDNIGKDRIILVAAGVTF